MENCKLSLSISASQKKNLGNYESADIFVSLSGVTEDTTEEQMQELIDGQGKLAWSKVTAMLREKIGALRSHDVA